MKTLIKIVLGGLGVVTAVAIAAAGYLIYPGTPSSASSLIFQGYVPLPSDSLLSVLDYLTVYDDKLFVTSESTGDVYRIHLRRNSLPTVTDISKLTGDPAAHGVVIDPSSHLAFVTRSEANTVDVFDPAKMATIKRIPVADDPDALFYDEFDKLVYVASGDSHLATLIDPATQATIATVPIGKAPDSVAFDPELHRIYTTGKSGVLAVVQQDEPNKYKVLDTIHLHYGAHTLTFDPATHALYVAYAGLVV